MLKRDRSYENWFPRLIVVPLSSHEVSNERVMVCALVKPSYVDNLSGLHIFLDHLKTVSMTSRV